MIIEHKHIPIRATYDFHGIFRLRLRTASQLALEHFQAEYGHFQSTTPEPPDLELTVGPFSLARPDDWRVVGDYLVANQWLYGQQRHKITRWRFALSNLGGRATQLYFQGGRLSLDFFQKYVVEQIMRYKICAKGYVLLHAGCVARNGRSVLFPGLGHAGKTQLALRQVLAGWQFQADDYTFVSDSGQTYSYPRRMHLSNDARTAGSGVRRRFSFKHQLSMRAKRLAYWLSLRYGNMTEALQLTELVPEATVARQARLQSVLMLVSGLENEPAPARRLEEAELVNRLMAINGLEGQKFHSLLLSAQCLDDTISVSRWWAAEREILQRATSGVRGYVIAIPYQARNPAAAVDRAGEMLDAMLIQPQTRAAASA